MSHIPFPLSLGNERKRIRASINKSMIERPIYTKEQLISWINRFKYGDIDDKKYQKEVIDTFLNSIYVYDDRLVFTYNYKHGTDSVPIEFFKSGINSNIKSIGLAIDTL